MNEIRDTTGNILRPGMHGYEERQKMKTQPNQTNEGNAPRIATGDRVRLTVDVERYPHFVAKKGLTGIVLETHASDWPNSIAVQMDEPLLGAEEWDNTIIWQDEEREYFLLQVEKVQ